MRKSISAKELIAKRYGEKGTKEREQFREDAFSYYFGEIIKNRRKELKLSQENLAKKVGKKDLIFLESKTEKIFAYLISLYLLMR